ATHHGTPRGRADTDACGAEGRRRGFPAHRRGAPSRAPRALPPDAEVTPRRRRRLPGDDAEGVARAPPLSGPRLAAELAVPDRDKRLHRCDQAPPTAHGAVRAWAADPFCPECGV